MLSWIIWSLSVGTGSLQLKVWAGATQSLESRTAALAVIARQPEGRRSRRLFRAGSPIMPEGPRLLKIPLPYTRPGSLCFSLESSILSLAV